jgi:hypothetical protein
MSHKIHWWFIQFHRDFCQITIHILGTMHFQRNTVFMTLLGSPQWNGNLCLRSIHKIEDESFNANSDNTTLVAVLLSIKHNSWARNAHAITRPHASGKGNLQMIKNSTFCTKFFANFHYFCVLFLSSRQNSTKPQHFTMHHYSAKQHSGIIYYISQQSHVTHQLVLWNFVVIHIIIIVAHETIDGQPRCRYIITFCLAYGSGQPFSLAHSTT